MYNISGKNALITGSSRGVGQQIAMGLAAKGCNIILHARTAASCHKTIEMLKTYPISVYVVFGELSDETSVHQVIDQVNALGVEVDIVYNNAAIMTSHQSDIWQHSWEDWMQTMKTNVFATYTICAAFVPKMAERGYGRVVNLSSGITKTPELAPYSASKWAVIKLTEDLAAHYEDTNVRINCLDPGWLRTDMGSQNAPNAVEAVLPGALVPALLENDGANGKAFSALE
jgi:3-oxoacyl-[acyl-carrier protein] reductase